MRTPRIVLPILASLALSGPADANDEISEIDVCRDFSLIAKSVMTAVQARRPMSETLPRTRELVKSWAEKYGIEMEADEVNEGADVLVLPAYDAFVWPPDSQFNENRQKEIGEYENRYFELCYKSATSDED